MGFGVLGKFYLRLFIFGWCSLGLGFWFVLGFVLGLVLALEFVHCFEFLSIMQNYIRIYLEYLGWRFLCLRYRLIYLRLLINLGCKLDDRYLLFVVHKGLLLLSFGLLGSLVLRLHYRLFHLILGLYFGLIECISSLWRCLLGYLLIINRSKGFGRLVGLFRYWFVRYLFLLINLDCILFDRYSLTTLL